LLAITSKTIPSRALFLEQPCKFVVRMDVEFDYNYKTFVFTERPRLVPRTKLDPELQETGKNAFIGLAPHAPGTYVDHIAVVFYRHYAYSMPMRMDPVGSYPCPLAWDKVLDSMLDLRLYSSIFDRWSAEINRNTIIQLAVLDASECTRQFSLYALKAYTDTSRPDKNLGILVNVEMGRQLAQIKKLVDYKVVEEDEIPQVAAQATATDNTYYHLPIVFCNPRAKLLSVLPVRIPNQLFLTTSYRQMNPTGAAGVAQENFELMQALSLPPVQSPSIA
jgi:hypothetical protein